MMDYLEVAFVLAMLLFPAMLTVFVRRQPQEAGRSAGDADLDLRAKQRRLWLWTAVAIGAYAALTLNGNTEIVSFLWMACFPLWFLLAMPVLRAKDPGWRGVPRTATRSASLVRRDVLPPRLKRAWIYLTALWALLVTASIAGLAAGAPGAGQWWLITFPVVAGAEVALFYWCAKRSLIEPEPHPANETPEIRAARESLRGLKLYAWLWAAAACVLVFSAPALMLIWWGPSALVPAIAAGAGGGAVVGIGGGVVGTIADLRRARLNRLCIDEPIGHAE
jgi:hypothetical protein